MVINLDIVDNNKIPAVVYVEDMVSEYDSLLDDSVHYVVVSGKPVKEWRKAYPAKAERLSYLQWALNMLSAVCRRHKLRATIEFEGSELPYVLYHAAYPGLIDVAATVGLSFGDNVHPYLVAY